jgi:ATP-dependent Clp protease ATP-binding subunit ClpC
VVLFDEIEKAHPDVFNTLLQVLDEGRLTDSLGRTVDFTNTIIVMTSNVGAKKVSEFGTGIGFQTNTSLIGRKSRIEAIIRKELKNKFTPEFLNRLDDIVLFGQLEKDSILKIVDIELNKVIERLAGQNYVIKILKTAKQFISKQGYDPEYGARPLNRAVQTYVEDLLADAIINGVLTEGDTVHTIYHDKGKDKLSLKS